MTRVAVLASGEGSNLQALIDSVHGRQGIELVCVASDKADAAALSRANAAAIQTAVFPIADYPDRAVRDLAIAEHLRAHEADLVVLAGYMALLSAGFIEAFAGRIINVHPSLLPKYPGISAVEQALEAGDSETGVTIHYVDEGIDTGPIIAQEALSVLPGEGFESLTERIHRLEHRLLPEVVRELAAKPLG